MLLDRIARFVSPTIAFNETMPRIVALFSSASFTDRRGAIQALAMLARGCKDLMLHSIKDIVPLVRLVLFYSHAERSSFML